MYRVDTLKTVIRQAINNIIERENTEYAELKKIYLEVAYILKKENNITLQSQIRGRLQENCIQTKSYIGENLFETKKLRSGLWKNVDNHEKNCFKYIRYIKNSYLVTNDNWEHFYKALNVDGKYVLENNVDILYEIKLKEQIGICKAKIIILELKKIRELLRSMKKVDKCEEGYGTAFEVFAIAVIYNLNYEIVINKYIVHGDYDGGIDAIVYLNDSDEVDIYQIKLNEISDVAYDIMNKNYTLCVSDDVVPENGADLYNFILKRKILLQNRKMNLKTISWNSKKDSNITPLDIYNMFFKNKLLPNRDNNLTLYIEKPVLNSAYNIASYKDKNYTFFLNAEELIKDMLNALEIPKNSDISSVDFSRFFCDNIRGAMPINKNIYKTIIEDPNNFINYNVGIDITGKVRDLSYQLEIKNPIINNGQQTIMSLIKTNINLDKIMLCIHVKNQSDLIVKSNISIFTNEQKPVRPVDRLSVNYFIRDIQKKIFDDGEYFLQIYSSGDRENDYIINSIYGNKVIVLSDFIKLYFAVITTNLGGWKNAFNQELEKININKPFDLNLSFKVCESIVRFESYLDTISDKRERDNLRSADLAFMYLLCKENLSVEQARKVIDMINNEYFYSKHTSKLIDVYKSSTIMNRLNRQLKRFEKNNKLDLVK